jgi:TolA-binding protein
LVDNSNPDAYYWLARTYDAMQKKEEAIENYERTLALDPKFKEARERLKTLMP